MQNDFMNVKTLSWRNNKRLNNYPYLLILTNNNINIINICHIQVKLLALKMSLPYYLLTYLLIIWKSEYVIYIYDTIAGRLYILTRATRQTFWGDIWQLLRSRRRWMFKNLDGVWYNVMVQSALEHHLEQVPHWELRM